MQITRCPSPICGRPFQVNRFRNAFTTSLEKGKINCPHCGMLLLGDNDSVFLTHALSVDEEARLDQETSVVVQAYLREPEGTD